MKLEKGMYVRTKKGIAKVINIDDLDYIAWTDKEDIYFGVIIDSISLDWNVYDNGIVLEKPSFYPIDLIKVGDYVNGNKVSYIDDLTGTMRQFNYDYEDEMDRGHWNEEIKTILTKECFENNCYKVGDE